ncbi:MAG: DnaJ domain-containing protein [Acidimicrobiia bacterium]
MATDCPYAVLGVDTDADMDTVRRTFRARAHACHPDHGGDRREFERVMAAFRDLCSRPRAAVVRPAPVNPYVGFLRSLDEAARLNVAPVRRAHPARATATKVQSGIAFAAVFQRELARLAK